MPGRCSRPALAFSALALLAALAPAEGGFGDGQADASPQAHAGDPRPVGPATDTAAEVRGTNAQQAGGPAHDEAPVEGAQQARAPHGPELRDNPLFGYADGRAGSAAPTLHAGGSGVGGGSDDDGGGDGKAGTEAGRGPAHGAGEAEWPQAAALPGAYRVAERRAAAPALPLSAAVGPRARTRAQATADALAAHAARIERRVAAYRKWGLAQPLPPRPAPPELTPRARDAQVVRRVPTDDKVVFLTIDDGAMKSPAFLRMIDDLDIPVTSFLTDDEALLGAGYEYFRTLEHLGGTTQNHTLHHSHLPSLSYAEQRREICGQQDRLQEELGGPQPRFFRPPYGAYDQDTLRAARDCGIDAVVLWGMEAWADRIEFQEPGRQLYPGAIILTHYRGADSWNGTMVDMLRRVLRLAAEQGYALARLEDYL